MNKKFVIVTALIVLALEVSTVAYAKEKNTAGETVTTKLQINQEKNYNSSNAKNDFYNLLKKYDYKELSNELKKGNYEAMDDFMDNMTDEDYQNMIDIMRESGYVDMAEMMEAFSKDEMIKMHNAMNEGGGCHGSDGNYNTMMGNSI